MIVSAREPARRFATQPRIAARVPSRCRSHSLVIDGDKLSIQDFGPTCAKACRRASLHATLVLRDIRAGYDDVDAFDAGSLGDLVPSLTCEPDRIDRVSDDGATQI